MHSHAEELAGARERAAPLAGARLGRQPLHALLLVDPRLHDRGVQLVAAHRADVLGLVVDVRRGVERLLEGAGAEHRAGPVEAVDVAHLVRDLDHPLLRHLLDDQAHREDRGQGLGSDRLARGRVQRRRQRRRQIRRDVVEVGRDLGLGQGDLGVGHGKAPGSAVHGGCDATPKGRQIAGCEVNGRSISQRESRPGQGQVEVCVGEGCAWRGWGCAWVGCRGVEGEIPISLGVLVRVTSRSRYTRPYGARVPAGLAAGAHPPARSKRRPRERAGPWGAGCRGGWLSLPR